MVPFLFSVLYFAAISTEGRRKPRHEAAKGHLNTNRIKTFILFDNKILCSPARSYQCSFSLHFIFFLVARTKDCKSILSKLNSRCFPSTSSSYSASSKGTLKLTVKFSTRPHFVSASCHLNSSFSCCCCNVLLYEKLRGDAFYFRFATQQR